MLRIHNFCQFNRIRARSEIANAEVSAAFRLCPRIDWDSSVSQDHPGKLLFALPGQFARHFHERFADAEKQKLGVLVVDS
jgi:hypothetical protein